jgi:hypothetical protein
MHELIVSPFLGNYIVVRQGRRNGVTIPRAKYIELVEAIPLWHCAGLVGDSCSSCLGSRYL